MGLSQKDIDKFKEIYYNKYGKEISDEEALKQVTSLINMMKIIYKPITKKEFEKYENSKSKINLQIWKIKEHS